MSLDHHQSPRAPDLDALLVALVLSPATYSRNRFFGMYTDPAVRRVRRRATRVRSVLKHFAALPAEAPISLASRALPGSAEVELTYLVPAIGLRRTTTLTPLELSLVRFCLARSAGAAPAPVLTAGDADRCSIEDALRRLGPGSSHAEAAGDPGA